MKKIFMVLLSLCMLFSLVACGTNSTTSDSDKPQTETIAFAESAITVSVGETVALKINTNIDEDKITYQTTDDNVAKYFGGEVLGKNRGTCTITATTPNGTKAECTVTVLGKIINSGKCGENITWTYYDDYTLVFSGSGDMQEYYESVWYQPNNVLIPWHPYSAQVKEIVIEDGITSICAFAFVDARLCTKITIPDSVTYIGHCAFEYNNSLEYVMLNNTITKLGCMVFHSCNFNVYYNGTKADFDKIEKIVPDDATTIEIDAATGIFKKVSYSWDSKYEGKILFYSETSQADSWHYVDGIPTKW